MRILPESIKCHVQMLRLSVYLLSVCLLLGACTPKVQRGIPVPSTTAEPLWDSYVTYSETRENDLSPYRLKASLRYGTEGDTRRVTTLLWGNGEEPQGKTSSGAPVRLDVMAGMNSLVARIREASDGLVVYAPGENSALVHTGKQRVVLRFGKPVPFTLRDFSALMRGRFQEVFGSARGTDPMSTKEGNVAYLVADGSLPGTVELRSDGLPVRWSQSNGWIMDVGYSEADGTTPPLPEKIKLVHPDGYSAILLVKDRETPSTPFTQKQLSLVLPEGVAIETFKGKQ